MYHLNVMISAITECVYWAINPPTRMVSTGDALPVTSHCRESGSPAPMFTAVLPLCAVSFTRFFLFVILKCCFSQGCLWNSFFSHSNPHLPPQSITHAFSCHYHYIINPKSTSFVQTSLELLIHITNCLFGISN